MRRRYVLAGAGALVAALLGVGASGRWLEYTLRTCGMVGCEVATPSTPIAIVLYSIAPKTATMVAVAAVLVTVGLAMRQGAAWTLVLGVGVVLATLPLAFPRQQELVAAPDFYVSLHGTLTPSAYVFLAGALGIVLIAGILRSAWIERQIPAVSDPVHGRRR